MTNSVRVDVVVAAMKVLASGGGDALAMAPPEEWELLTSDNMWLSTEAALATRTLETAIYGTLDAVGLPRIQVGAEYVAAAIAVFVKPANFQQACIRLAGHGRASTVDLGAGFQGSDGIEEIKPGQLFALVIACRSRTAEFQQAFEARTQMKLNRVQGVA